MGKKIKREDGYNTCLTDCVAKYFGLDPKDVPFFIGYKDFPGVLIKFYRKRGLKIFFARYNKAILKNKKKLYIVSGVSMRSKATKVKDYFP